MSTLSENVIPSDYGKVFETDASGDLEIEVVKNAISVIQGIKDVFVSKEDFPKEITVHTSEVVSIEDIQNQVIAAGYHVVPRGMFAL